MRLRDMTKDKIILLYGEVIHLDRPMGTVITGTDSSGNSWYRVYAVDYGYFPGCMSTDGDYLDVFVGPRTTDAEDAYVIQQIKEDGSYDEPKVMLGFACVADAVDCYRLHSASWMFGGVEVISIASLRACLAAARESGKPVVLSSIPIDFDDTIEEEPVSSAAPIAGTSSEASAVTMEAKETSHARSGQAAEGPKRSLDRGQQSKDVGQIIARFSRRFAGDAWSKVPGTNARAPGPNDAQKRASSDIEIRGIRTEKREVDFIASTDAVDSYGEIVRQNYRLERFKKNPNILFAHDSWSLPVGIAVKDTIRVEGNKLLMTVKFFTAKANPLAEFLFNCILEGGCRSGSIGFLSHKVTREEVDGVERTILDDNELFEFSITPVPANPEALAVIAERTMRSLKSAGYSERQFDIADAAKALGASPSAPGDGWDPTAAVDAWRKACSSDGSGDWDTIDWDRYQKMFAWRDSASADVFGGYKLPYREVERGSLSTSTRSLLAAAESLMKGADIPDADREEAKAIIEKDLKQLGVAPPWASQQQETTAMPPTPEEKAAQERASNKALVDKLTEKTTEAGELAGQVKTLKAENDVLKREVEASKATATASDTRAKALEGQLASLTERAEKAEQGLAAKDIAERVGKKMFPSEEQSSMEIFKAHQSLLAAGKSSTLWTDHLKSIDARPDLGILGKATPADRSTPQPQGAPPGLESHQKAGSGDDAAGAANFMDAVEKETDRLHERGMRQHERSSDDAQMFA